MNRRAKARKLAKQVEQQLASIKQIRKWLAGIRPMMMSDTDGPVEDGIITASKDAALSSLHYAEAHLADAYHAIMAID